MTQVTERNTSQPRGSVTVDPERCKGCTLCVTACKKGVLATSTNRNVKGYVPVEAKENDKCTGCGLCALMCPDLALKVYRHRPRKQSNKADIP